MVVHVLWNRAHVIVSMDETQLATVKINGVGMISGRSRKRTDRRRAPRDPVDKHNTKVTYIAAVSDSSCLQPVLPQVILPRYTRSERPPAHVLDTYADFGYPFEFWHGTAGVTTPGVIQTWLTRLRSVISSFNDSTWIVLAMDCHTNHLCIQTMAHIRRLGILPLFVPAKLTWLLQILDVYAFGLIKKDMRLEELRTREVSASGIVARPQRMRFAVSSIRRTIINRDWSAAFNKLGYGNSDRPVASQLQQYLPEGDIDPVLPTLAQFADLIGRPEHTEITQRLYRMCMRAALDAGNAPLTASPPAGSFVPLPFNANATMATATSDFVHQEPDHVLRRFLDDIDEEPPSLTEQRLARNVFVDRRGRQVP